MRRALNPNTRRDQDLMRRDLGLYRSGKKMYPNVEFTGEMLVSELPRKAKKIAKALSLENDRIQEDQEYFDGRVGFALTITPEGRSTIISAIGRNAFRIAIIDLQDPDGKKATLGELWRHEIGEVFLDEGLRMTDGRSITLEDGMAVPNGHVDILSIRRSNVAMVMLSGIIEEDHTQSPPTIV